MKARGQATVELALGGTLVVTILLLGLYLTEISFLSLKVQEAAAAALWESAGRPAHDFQGASQGADPSEPLQEIFQGPNSVEKRLTARYRNFDGLTEGGDGTSRLFARGRGLTVSCEQVTGGPLRFNVPLGPEPEINQVLRGWYRPGGALACTASAEAVAVDLPLRFLDRDEGGFFHRFRDDQPIRLCGSGRAVSGECRGTYGLLLGDWGLDAVNSTAGDPKIVWDSPLPNSYGRSWDRTNNPYRGMVKELFVASGQRYDAGGTTPGAAARFSRKVGDGMPRSKPYPHNEKRFFMSYAGVESNYIDAVEGEAFQRKVPCKNCHFNTAGTLQAVGNPPLEANRDWRNLRQPCFLGIGPKNAAGNKDCVR